MAKINLCRRASAVSIRAMILVLAAVVPARRTRLDPPAVLREGA